MGLASMNKENSEKSTDFRNASTPGFVGNLIRIELLDMVHGRVYGVNHSDFPSMKWFHQSENLIR